ncbi:hypothetical protein PR202_gb23361 [Eleusine coracana subsp. coracana]|uniref:F5/8 type C domain-containing protein n=1 Tax=Eleusine coracana subsp. coracana TaxID=191504 RepID=A0AAV5FJ84_ELECO|nr:hypothetical protein PR202_gb23361 [Eleusine coracana subsp. coracana]
MEAVVSDRAHTSTSQAFRGGSGRLGTVAGGSLDSGNGSWAEVEAAVSDWVQINTAQALGGGNGVRLELRQQRRSSNGEAAAAVRSTAVHWRRQRLVRSTRSYGAKESGPAAPRSDPW